MCSYYSLIISIRKHPLHVSSLNMRNRKQTPGPAGPTHAGKARILKQPGLFKSTNVLHFHRG